MNTTQMIVRWNTIGVAPKAFEVSIGDMSWFYDPSTTAAVMDLTYLSNGTPHPFHFSLLYPSPLLGIFIKYSKGLTSLTVAAYGASTPYMLSYDEVCSTPPLPLALPSRSPLSPSPLPFLFILFYLSTNSLFLFFT